MSPEPNSILDFAQRILRNAQNISAAFDASQTRSPSLNDEGNTSWPAEVLAARFDLLEATEKLRQLVADPLETIMDQIQPEITVPHVIIEFELAKAVPIRGTASYTTIANTSGLPEREVRRVLKLAMMDGIFRQTASGDVAHTPTSRLLAEDENLLAWAEFTYGEIMPAKMQTAIALRKAPGSDNSNESGFALSNKSGLNLFKYLEAHPAKAKSFRSGMLVVHKRGGFELEHLITHFPAQAALNQGGICVDVGGSSGSVVFALARALPGVYGVVQDLPATIDQHPAVPGELQGRVEFTPYDFFTPQPVTGATVYLLRNILHNWSDADAIRIIQGISAVMSHASHLIINDWCLSDDPKYGSAMNKRKRRMDISMLTLFNTRERDANEWKQLLEEADSQLVIESITHPAGSNYSIIVARKR